MAHNIVKIIFGINGSPTFVYQGKSYSAESFPLHVHCGDYNYRLDGPLERYDEIDKIILEIDEIFNMLKGGFCRE